MDSAGPIVLFDGVCNMCNGVVNFLIDHDPRAQLRFASLQSAAAKDTLARRGAAVADGDPDTIILVEGGKVYERSTAAVRIARYMAWPYKGLYAFVVLPRPLRDGVYAWIARNRYRWFGKAETCRVPTPELRARFLT